MWCMKTSIQVNEKIYFPPLILVAFCNRKVYNGGMKLPFATKEVKR